MHKNVKDITGQQFNNWTVIQKSESRQGKAYWLCICRCGTEQIVSGYKLRNGAKGCRRCAGVEDLSGRKFGSWLVLKRDYSKSGNVYWLCRCDCGLEKPVLGCHLVRNKTLSCRKCSNHKHKGKLNGTLIARIRWGAKKRGIFIEDTNAFFKYVYDLFYEVQEGKCALTGRDITIANCNKEQKSGMATASLDRIDSSKGYVRGNVQWVHKDVNLMKMNLDQKHFVDLCREVVEYAI